MILAGSNLGVHDIYSLLGWVAFLGAICFVAWIGSRRF